MKKPEYLKYQSQSNFKIKRKQLDLPGLPSWFLFGQFSPINKLESCSSLFKVFNQLLLMMSK